MSLPQMLRRSCLVAASVVTLAACQSAPQAEVFSWYHQLGGEYLFEFDSKACGVALDPASANFFDCMYERGYVLIDDAGNIVSEPASVAQQPLFPDYPSSASSD